MGSLISNGIGPVFRGSSLKFAEGRIPGAAFNTLNSAPYPLIEIPANGSIPIVVSAIIELNFSIRASTEIMFGFLPYLVAFGTEGSIFTIAANVLPDPGYITAGPTTFANAVNTSSGARLYAYMSADDATAVFQSSYYKIGYYEAIPS